MDSPVVAVVDLVDEWRVDGAITLLADKRSELEEHGLTGAGVGWVGRDNKLGLT